MAEFIVVAVWDTESDMGEVPLVLRVNADSEKSALKRVVKIAKSGELFSLAFDIDKERDKEYMEINMSKSFALELGDLISI